MKNISRRTFVGQTLAAGAAIAVAPGILRAQGANDKVGVAVIGAGGRGGSHTNAYLKDSRTEILYVVDVDQQHGNKMADAIAGSQGSRPKMVTDMRRVFDDQSVDAISTATPNHWHALCGIWAMQAGKDCYIEKPVCHNIAEGSALIAAARKYKRICQVGTQCRSNPALRDAVAFLHAGGIGEVKFARGLCYKRRKSIGALGDYAIPKEVDFDLWSGPAPITDPKCTRQQFHYDWHWQRLYGNGDLGNQGPHQTDIARWGLGIDSHPNSVLSYGGRLGYQAERKDPKYVDAGDTANTEVSIYDYGDKCIVFETRGLDVTEPKDDELNKLFASDRGNKVGVVFYGSDGILVQRSYGECVVLDPDMNEIKKFTGGDDQMHFGNFLDACSTRKMEDLHAEVREGHLSAGISHLGNISYYLGENNKASIDEIGQALSLIESLDDDEATLKRTVQHLKDNDVDLDKYPLSLGPHLKFDPEKEVFPDSPEATKLVSREYRKGFEVPKAADV
jgi:predicted dehydrogenase